MSITVSVGNTLRREISGFVHLWMFAFPAYLSIYQFTYFVVIRCMTHPSLLHAQDWFSEAQTCTAVLWGTRTVFPDVHLPLLNVWELNEVWNIPQRSPSP